MAKRVRRILYRRRQVVPASEQNIRPQPGPALQKRRTILIVDDDEALRQLVSVTLTRDGFDVVALPSGRDAVRKLTQVKFDAAVVEVRMPDMAGLDLMHVMNRMCPDILLIMLTEIVDPDSRFGSISKPDGLFAYLRKPCKLDELRSILQKAFPQQKAPV